MSDDHAKVKSRKYASDDDAENLLAGIFDDTEDSAREEQERIEAEMRAKKDDKLRVKEAAAQVKKDEAAARLSAEMERLEKVGQRRTQKLEALKIEELKDRGEWIDPEEERRKLEAKIHEEAEIAAMKKAAEEKARRKHHAANSQDIAERMVPAAAPKSNVAIIGGIIFALLLVMGGGAFAVLGGYQLDQATYSKAVFAPKDRQVALVEKSFTPLPKATPVAVASVDDGKSKKKRSRRGKRKSSSSKPGKKAAPISTKPKKSKENKRANELESMLNTDLFGGDSK